MDAIVERCAGLDVHLDTVVACVLYGKLDIKPKKEVKTFSTTTKGLLELLDFINQKECTHVAMESTGIYWKPVWNILESGAFELIVANAKKIKNKEDDKDSWKIHFNQNPNLIEYGNLNAEVIDYGVFDSKGNYLNVIDNEKEVVLKSKIKFHKEVDNPIFTMTIKNFNGIEVAGTNTMIEKIYPGKYEKDDVVEVSFIQKLPLAPNKYTLSFSCTHINAKGELEVLNRKYEALLIEIISSKNCVGMVSLDTKIEIERKNKDGKEKE